ncbi:MAG: M24 family metallopeptidase [Nanopusillaceae archaeon]
MIVNEGVAWLEVHQGGLTLHTSRIEAQRLGEEETLAISNVVVYPWYRVPPLPSPNDLEHALTGLRLVLSSEEQEKFRRLGRDAACAVGRVMREAKPSWTEQELARAVAEECYSQGITALVLLVATEERIYKYRHPLPKNRALGHLGMVVICGRRHGLVANLTRIRVWGKANARELYKKIVNVESAALEATKPGVTLGQILLTIQKAYQEIGAGEAYEEHHQGGIAGYRPREVIATPGNCTELEVGMAVAWNPSLPGSKVEDTFLMANEGWRTSRSIPIGPW